MSATPGFSAHHRALLHALVSQEQGQEISDACARTIAYLFSDHVPKPSIAMFCGTGAIVSTERVWGALFADADSRWQYGYLSADDRVMADMLGTYLIHAVDESGTRDRVPGWQSLGAESIYLAVEHGYPSA